MNSFHFILVSPISTIELQERPWKTKEKIVTISKLLGSKINDRKPLQYCQIWLDFC